MSLADKYPFCMAAEEAVRIDGEVLAETAKKFGETQVIYELGKDLKPIRHDYLGDAQRVQKAMQTVASHASLKD